MVTLKTMMLRRTLEAILQRMKTGRVTKCNKLPSTRQLNNSTAKRSSA
jgi:hypothetical protein